LLKPWKENDARRKSGIFFGFVGEEKRKKIHHEPHKPLELAVRLFLLNLKKLR